MPSNCEKIKVMAISILNKIEYLVLLVAAFAAQSKISEAEAYRYLSRYGALALCENYRYRDNRPHPVEA